MSDWVKAWGLIDEQRQVIQQLTEALLYALDQHEGRLTPMHNHWSAGAREALTAAEPYLKGK